VSPRDSSVSVYDESAAAAGTVIARLPIAGDPYAIAVDVADHRVYTANLDATVSVIDESAGAGSGRVTATVPVGP